MKKALIALAIVIVLALLVLWFQSCEPRQKDASDEANLLELTDEETQTAFIKANTDFTCQIKSNPSLVEDEDNLKSLLTEAYKKHGLPVQDNSKMIDILDRYEDNKEVINIIKENVESC